MRIARASFRRVVARLGSFSPAARQFLAFSLLISIAFAIFNWRMTGMSIVAIGLACNLVVLLANQAMPVRAESVVRAGIADESSVATADLGPARRLAEPGDRLEPLSAIVPLSALGMVVTFGDLIALFGLLDVGFRLARRTASRHSAARGPAWAHARRQHASSALPAWATPKSSSEGIDDWVLDLRETIRTEEAPPLLASLAPDDDIDEPAPELEVRYSGQPLPSRH